MVRGNVAWALKPSKSREYSAGAFPQHLLLFEFWIRNSLALIPSNSYEEFLSRTYAKLVWLTAVHSTGVNFTKDSESRTELLKDAVSMLPVTAVKYTIHVKLP